MPRTDTGTAEQEESFQRVLLRRKLRFQLISDVRTARFVLSAMEAECDGMFSAVFATRVKFQAAPVAGCFLRADCSNVADLLDLVLT